MQNDGNWQLHAMSTEETMTGQANGSILPMSGHRGRGKRVKKTTLGERFRDALEKKKVRDRRDWTHQEIADAIGRPQSRAFISTIAGYKRAPKKLNIEEVWEPLANLLEINLWWLLYDRGPREKEKDEVSRAKNELYDKLVGVSDEDATAVSQLVDAYLAGKKGREPGNPQ